MTEDSKTHTSHYDQALHRGKTRMHASLDPSHNTTHAQHVEAFALEIYDELKKEHYPGIESLSPMLVSLASWWHDCYKAQCDRFTLYAAFHEGAESEKIIREELTSLLSTTDLDLLCEAVRYHAGTDLFPYFFFNKPRSILHMILLEADSCDIIDIDRAKRLPTPAPSITEKIWTVVEILESITLPLYLRTRSTRQNLGQRLWKFWGVWFWTDWMFFKRLFGRKR